MLCALLVVMIARVYLLAGGALQAPLTLDAIAGGVTPHFVNIYEVYFYMVIGATPMK